MIQSDTVEFRGLSSRVSVVARDVEIEEDFVRSPHSLVASPFRIFSVGSVRLLR